MKLNNKDFEEMLTITEQCKVLVPKLSYNEELTKKIFYCMKDKEELDKESIMRSRNNYLILRLIGLNRCNTDTYKKLNDYMEYEY